MKRFKKFGAIFFISVYLFIGGILIIPASSLAVDVNFKPQISIPGSEFQQGVGTTIGTTTDVENMETGNVEKIIKSNLLARYVRTFYNWGLSIVGVLAVLILMAAGIIWITSMGDSGKISNAKKMIEGSILGSALLIGAWFFLNTINPDLTKLPSLSTVVITGKVIGCCESKDGTAIATTSDKCIASDKTFLKDVLVVNNKCDKIGCCITTGTGDQNNNYTCEKKLSSTCAGFTEDGECSNNPKCLEKTSTLIDCNGIKDGELTANTGAYCYANTIYYGKGLLGEPCGNETPTGKCFSDSCGSEYKREYWGGRSCGKDLACCILKTQ